MAVGNAVAVGIGVSMTMTTFGGGRVEVGEAVCGVQAIPKSRSNPSTPRGDNRGKRLVTDILTRGLAHSLRELAFGFPQ